MFQQLNKFDPYFVGFDKLFNQLNAFETNPVTGGNYPPYNIIKTEFICFCNVLRNWIAYGAIKQN